MMKLAVLAAAVGSAAAFAPVQQGRVATAVNSYENELGVLDPVGYWDPCGLAKNIDQDTFDQYRAAELKHGRVAQLAVIGYIVPELTRANYDFIPGKLSTADIPNGVAALEAIPSLGWAQIVFFIGAVDYWGVLGNFEFGKKFVGGTEDELKTKELQHGRLAMLAILELLRHDSQNMVSPGFDGLDKLITGLPFIYE